MLRSIFLFFLLIATRYNSRFNNEKFPFPVDHRAFNKAIREASENCGPWNNPYC